VAHTQIFAFNLFFAMMLISILSIIPGQGFNAELHFSWGGIIELGGIGSFDITLTPLTGIVVLVAVISVITAACILLTTRVLESGLEFSPFKLIAMILGIVFVSTIAALEILLISPLPIVLQFILIFPTQIMMVYALVIDIGTHGGD
jgi:hypothetical protein